MACNQTGGFVAKPSDVKLCRLSLLIRNPDLLCTRLDPCRCNVSCLYGHFTNRSLAHKVLSKEIEYRLPSFLPDPGRLRVLVEGFGGILSPASVSRSCSEGLFSGVVQLAHLWLCRLPSLEKVREVEEMHKILWASPTRVIEGQGTATRLGNHLKCTQLSQRAPEVVSQSATHYYLSIHSILQAHQYGLQGPESPQLRQYQYGHNNDINRPRESGSSYSHT